MIKGFLKLLLIGVIGFLGYGAFQAYQKGYFSMPDMPEGSYAYSRKDGMRGIILNAEVSDPIADMPKFFRRINLANPDRRYFGVPFAVAPWLEDVWSICISPSEEERVEFPQSMPDELKQDLAYARFDAVCRIDVEGEMVLRGLLYSVPNL
jgi:hypothetical protein